MSKINDGGPAFPVSYYVNTDGETFESSIQGMALRDYFAAKAMQGLIIEGMKSRAIAAIRKANDDCGIEEGEAHDSAVESSNFIVATEAYMLADAMLKAREE